MEGLSSFILFALFFYLMMRFGCGAHMVHGHGGHTGHDGSDQGNVSTDKGYGVMHQGNLYRFCSRKCLDQFDEQPSLFIHKHIKEVGHE